MRAIIQRVSQASVGFSNKEMRTISRGLLIYLGVGQNDTQETARRLAEKIIHLRIFANSDNKFDKSLLDIQGEALVISQFTLFANLKGGRRPDFTTAASPATAKPLYEQFSQALASLGIAAKTGEFGAHMAVSSVNDGPVTIWLDTNEF